MPPEPAPDTATILEAIADAVANAEREAVAVVGGPPEPTAPAQPQQPPMPTPPPAFQPPRSRGRPPKGACPGCGQPLARGKTCPICIPIARAQPPRPAWQPLPLDDLRERLQILQEAGADTYEDGQVKITFNLEAQRERALKRTGTGGERERW
jgi:hypothetical protein